MTTNALSLAVLLPVGLGLFACASREEIHTERAAQQVTTDAEDDARCRAEGEKGTPPYVACRQNLATERARQADIDYQKARDFDRVLGGLDDR